MISRVVYKDIIVTINISYNAIFYEAERKREMEEKRDGREEIRDWERAKKVGELLGNKD